MLCSRAHRRNWLVFTWLIDRLARLTHGHKRHCEACWRWDSINGAYDTVE